MKTNNSIEKAEITDLFGNKKIVNLNKTKEDNIEKGIIESFEYGNDKLDLLKLGKEVKPKLKVLKEYEEGEKTKIHLKMLSELKESGITPTDEFDSYCFHGVKNQITDIPKRFHYNLCYFSNKNEKSLLMHNFDGEVSEEIKPESREQAEACSKYNDLARNYIEKQVEIVKIDALIRNIPDDKKVKLTLQQLSVLGF